MGRSPLRDAVALLAGITCASACQAGKATEARGGDSCETHRFLEANRALSARWTSGGGVSTAWGGRR